MQKLKCVVSYDGTNYSGFQIQQNAHTIQVEIENALQKIHKNTYTPIYAAGRTDKGVHAKGQVFHFSTNITMPLRNWRKAINQLLPKDIFINTIEHVSEDFHARYHAEEREYRYFVWNATERDVFKWNYSHYVFNELNLEAMQAACQLFIGTHDFTSFSSAKSNITGSKVRTIHEISCEKEGNEMVFILRGNGFLYNMVRIIVGVLIEVGKGKVTLADIQAMFQKKDRQSVGKTLPPQGLYLWKVHY